MVSDANSNFFHKSLKVAKSSIKIAQNLPNNLAGVKLHDKIKNSALK